MRQIPQAPVDEVRRHVEAGGQAVDVHREDLRPIRLGREEPRRRVAIEDRERDEELACDVLADELGLVKMLEAQVPHALASLEAPRIAQIGEQVAKLVRDADALQRMRLACVVVDHRSADAGLGAGEDARRQARSDELDVGEDEAVDRVRAVGWLGVEEAAAATNRSRYAHMRSEVKNAHTRELIPFRSGFATYLKSG